jgi:hypothetical protein
MAIERDGAWWLEESEVAELEQLSPRWVRHRMSAWSPSGPATDHQFLVWKPREEVLAQAGVPVPRLPGRGGRLIQANSMSFDGRERWKQRVLKAAVDGSYDQLAGRPPASHPRDDSEFRIPDSANRPTKALNNAGSDDLAPASKSATSPASSAQLPLLPAQTPHEEERERQIELVKASMPASQASACIQRFKYIEPLVNHDFQALGYRNKTTFYRQRAREAGVSQNTMIRWYQKFLVNECIADLGNEDTGPPKGTGAVLDASMRAHIKGCWEVEKLTRAQCCRSLESYLSEKQRGTGARWIYDVPHRTTIERFINNELQGDDNPLRNGADAVHAVAGHMDRKFTDLAALERVESDECRLNRLAYDPQRLFDSDGKPLVARYWLLTFYDCRSIYPVCWSLVHGSEFDLKHGISEQDEINLFDYLVRNYGKPAAIHSDRGRFRGKRFGGQALADKEIDEKFRQADGVLDQLNIAHNMPRVHNPRGTRLERFHRWVADWFRGKPGWIGANHQERKMTNGDAEFAQHKLWLKGKLAPGECSPLPTYDETMEEVNKMMEAWRDHSSQGTDMHGLSPRAVFVHNTPQQGFERISEERLNIVTAERYPDEAIAKGGIIELPDGSRYSHPLLALLPRGEKRMVIRLRHDHSSISVLPAKNGEEIIVAPRRVRVGGNDPDELARQAERQALIEKTIAGFGTRDLGPAVWADRNPDPEPLTLKPEPPLGHPETSGVDYIAERMGLKKHASGVGYQVSVKPEPLELAAEEFAPEDFTPSLHEMEQFTPEMEES